MPCLDDLVTRTLRDWAAAPFIWGVNDCGLSVLSYVEQATGRKPADRPDHKDRRGAARLLRRSGGYVAYSRHMMSALGCAVTDSPRRGDVALIDLPGGGLTACLSLGRTWAARGHKEIVVIAAEPAICWSVV